MGVDDSTSMWHDIFKELFIYVVAFIFARIFAYPLVLITAKMRERDWKKKGEDMNSQIFPRFNQPSLEEKYQYGLKMVQDLGITSLFVGWQYYVIPCVIAAFSECLGFQIVYKTLTIFWGIEEKWASIVYIALFWSDVAGSFCLKLANILMHEKNPYNIIAHFKSQGFWKQYLFDQIEYHSFAYPLVAWDLFMSKIKLGVIYSFLVCLGGRIIGGTCSIPFSQLSVHARVHQRKLLNLIRNLIMTMLNCGSISMESMGFLVCFKYELSFKLCVPIMGLKKNLLKIKQIFMLDKLCEIYPDFKYSATHKPKGQVVFIEDKINCSAGFLVSSLLDFYLKNSDGVVFVGLQQNYAHYFSLSKRLGNNIEPHISSGNLSYIDFFNGLTDWLPEDLPLTEETTIFWNPLPSKAISMKLNQEKGSEILERLYKLICENISKKNGTPCIIIDNLAVMLTLGVSIQDLTTFFSKLYEFIKSNEKKPSFYFCLTEDLLQESQEKLRLIFKKNCDYCFEVYQNLARYSPDVHGQFKATHFTDKPEKEFIYKFKLFENKAELFESLDKF